MRKATKNEIETVQLTVKQSLIPLLAGHNLHGSMDIKEAIRYAFAAGRTTARIDTCCRQAKTTDERNDHITTQFGKDTLDWYHEHFIYMTRIALS